LFSPITGKREWPVLHDHRNELVGRLSDVDHVHARARHHDVPRLHLRHLEHALYHGQRFRVEKPALMRSAQELDQLVPVLGLARDPRADAIENGGFGLIFGHD
jgi:hypothetical protein